MNGDETGRAGTADAGARHRVGIADYEISTDGAALSTSGLGSCVGLAIFDPASGLAGLAHLMLPSAAEVDEGHDAKFADTGTALLVREMEALGADARTMEATLAGGSDMLAYSEAAIGERNAAAVRAALAANGVRVVAEDLGGAHGRTLRLEPATGEVVVERAGTGPTLLGARPPENRS